MYNTYINQEKENYIIILSINLLMLTVYIFHLWQVFHLSAFLVNDNLKLFIIAFSVIIILGLMDLFTVQATPEILFLLW